MPRNCLNKWFWSTSRHYKRYGNQSVVPQLLLPKCLFQWHILEALPRIRGTTLAEVLWVNVSDWDAVSTSGSTFPSKACQRPCTENTLLPQCQHFLPQTCRFRVVLQSVAWLHYDYSCCSFSKDTRYNEINIHSWVFPDGFSLVFFQHSLSKCVWWHHLVISAKPSVEQWRWELPNNQSISKQHSLRRSR